MSAPTWGDPPPRRFERLRQLAFLVAWAGLLTVVALAGMR